MKKIIRRNPQKHERCVSGFSCETGIHLDISRENKRIESDDFIIEFNLSPSSAFGYVDKDGNVKCSYHMPDYLEKVQEEYNKIDKKNVIRLRKFFMISYLTLYILSIIVMFFAQNFANLLMAISFFIWGFSNSTSMIYSFIMRSLKVERFVQTHRFHSAEHAVVNAYYDLGRVPTLEEIKNYSNFAYNCGAEMEVKKMLPMLIMGFSRLFPNDVWIFVFIGMLIIVFLFMKKYLYYTEIITLKEPTDLEYKVAIKTLEFALKTDNVRTVIEKSVDAWMDDYLFEIVKP